MHKFLLFVHRLFSFLFALRSLNITAEANVRKLGDDAMRRGNESINKYLQVPELKTRHDEIVRVSKFVLKRANTVNSCMILGPEGIGKSVLSRGMVKLLRTGLKDDRGNQILPATPAIYIRVGKDESQCIHSACEAFGIDDSDATFDHILQLIKRTCYALNQPNIVVFDDISHDSPFFHKIDNISRALSENHPSTVVVLVTSNTTDVFAFRRGILFFLIVYYN